MAGESFVADKWVGFRALAVAAAKLTKLPAADNLITKWQMLGAVCDYAALVGHHTATTPNL